MGKKKESQDMTEQVRNAASKKEAQKRLAKALGGRDVADDTISLSLDSLTEEDREKLSKVLFPDTHTDCVTVLGKERILRPVPLKVSRQLFELLKEVAGVTEGELEEPTEDLQTDFGTLELDFEKVVVKNIVAAVRILADYYGEDWADIKEALADEGVALAEMEAIVYTQQHLNGANDFFLQPLRTFIKLLQMREIAMLLMEKFVSTSISLPS